MDYKQKADLLLYWADSCDRTNSGCQVGNLLKNAATAITDLLARAEEAEARCEMMEKIIKEYQDTIIPGYRELSEKAEMERDAAVSDLETIMAYGEEDLDTCEFCKNGQCYYRGGTKPCLPKWRGQKEE